MIFEGKSQSNARVSAFMRAIEASSWLQTPKLTVIQSNLQLSNITATEQLSDFTLRAEQEKQNAKTEEGGVNESVGN